MDLVSPKPFVIIRIDMKNHTFNVPVSRGARGRPAVEMFVVGAPVDVQYPAEGFDVMLKAEFVYGV